MSRPTAYLNALRAFEAAARHESVAGAARELNVSHSGVSRHIKNLEEWLETPLFHRKGNRATLTEEARMLAPRLSEAFQIINESCDTLRTSPARKRLSIAAEPAFASRWLRPQIAAFLQDNPGVDISIIPSWSPPGPADSSSDVVIHFASRLHSSAGTAHPLFHINAFPACAPDLLRQVEVGSVAEVRDLPLVHDNGRDTWRAWFAQYEPHSALWQSGQVYADLSLAIDAAVDGEGVILADERLFKKEIGSGTLVKLDERTVPCARYCAVFPDSARKSKALPAFREWLLNSADTC